MAAKKKVPLDTLRVRHIKELKKKVTDLETEKQALFARIADLEGVLSPIVFQINRHALNMRGKSPDQKVTLTHRAAFLRKVREVLENNPPGCEEKDYPDFHTTARHTIEDLGKLLLDIGTLAHEMQIAYDAGYEHRRSMELAKARGRKVDDRD